MIDLEHAVWTTRSNRMVLSWIDGQKSTRTSTWNQGVRNGVRLIQLRSTTATRSVKLVVGVGRTAERGGSGDIQG